jgi:hypothetical protein
MTYLDKLADMIRALYDQKEFDWGLICRLTEIYDELVEEGIENPTFH